MTNSKQTSNSGKNCPVCNGVNVVTQQYGDTLDFRSLVLEVEGLERQYCNDCGEVFETKEQTRINGEKVRSAYGVKRDAERARLNLLSAQQIRDVRDLLGLTQREASELLGGGSNSFNKYESGEVLQSVPMDRLLRVAITLGPNFRDVISSIRSMGPVDWVLIQKPHLQLTAAATDLRHEFAEIKRNIHAVVSNVIPKDVNKFDSPKRHIFSAQPRYVPQPENGQAVKFTGVESHAADNDSDDKEMIAA
jgi:putative zinc finger/helix-turn-helix YgiT family protein